MVSIFIGSIFHPMVKLKLGWRLKFEVGIKFQKFQKEKMKLDFYTPSYPTFSDVGHFGRFSTDEFLAMYLNLNSQGTIVPSGDILCLNGLSPTVGL